MDPLQTASEGITWVDFAIVVWKDIWSYMVTSGISLLIGLFLPQFKVKNPFRKASE